MSELKTFDTLPKGPDTQVGDMGSSSLEVKFKDCIARAIYKKPDILILDESQML